MALWNKIQQLPQEYFQKLKAHYSKYLYPIEVREALAAFIEEKFVKTGSPDDLGFQQHVLTTYELFIKELEVTVSTNSERSWVLSNTLGQALLQFKNYGNKLELYKIINDGLLYEWQLVHSKFDTNKGAEIKQKINDVNQLILDITQDVKNMSQTSDNISIRSQEIYKYQAYIDHYANLGNDPETVAMREKIEKNGQKLKDENQATLDNFGQLKLCLSEKSKAIYLELEQLQKRIVMNELGNWKREQQLSVNAGKFEPSTTLDNIQEWCQSLAHLILSARQIIMKANSIIENNELLSRYYDNILPQLQESFSDLSKNLIKSTFVVEKQPPPVIKTSSRFTTTARLLVVDPSCVHMPPQVKVSIISEQQALFLKRNEIAKLYKDNSGDLINNTGTMEHQPATKQLAISFRNMALKKINRTEKKGSESVMDEKFCLLYQTHFQSGVDVYYMFTLSLPVTVIVHTNQEPPALANVTWDYAFSLPDREPFQVPDKVPWSKVAELLSMKFYNYTGKSLDEGNLRFLAEKAFRGPCTENSMLTYAQFAKDDLPDRNFTFFAWFYAIMKLTKDYLKGPWKDGAIMGFVNKSVAEEMLKQQPPGTFLLRFSDSQLGGITIACIDFNNEVQSLQPFVAKNLEVRSLPDTISDLEHLVYLYPAIPKHEIFQKYYTPLTDSLQRINNGYVPSILRTHVFGNISNNVANSPMYPRPDSASSFAPSMATTIPFESEFSMEDVLGTICSFDSEYQMEI